MLVDVHADVNRLIDRAENHQIVGRRRGDELAGQHVHLQDNTGYRRPHDAALDVGFDLLDLGVGLLDRDLGNIKVILPGAGAPQLEVAAGLVEVPLSDVGGEDALAIVLVGNRVGRPQPASALGQVFLQVEVGASGGDLGLLRLAFVFARLVLQLHNLGLEGGDVRLGRHQLRLQLAVVHFEELVTCLDRLADVFDRHVYLQHDARQRTADGDVFGAGLDDAGAGNGVAERRARRLDGRCRLRLGLLGLHDVDHGEGQHAYRHKGQQKGTDALPHILPQCL